MNTCRHWLQRAAFAVVTVAALSACGGGRDGGMPPGPAAGPSVDAFTSTVATMTREAPEDTGPVDIEPIPVVLVDDKPAATVN